MKRNFVLLAFTFYLIFLSCNPSSEEQASAGEGMVTYKITYLPGNPYHNVRMLPEETMLVFKDKKAGFITSAFGMIQMVNLLDAENRNYISLLINSLGENFAFTETPEDISEQEKNPVYQFKKTGEKKLIAGLECDQAIVKNTSDGSSFEIYYYPKIKVYLGCSPYKDFNYLLMEYKHIKYDLPMHLEATKVDFGQVDSSLLTVQGDYRWVDKKTFFEVLRNLKVPF